ncbi:MAG: dihydroorotase [Lentimicrobiaceae bacterium]|jgi:dihydroorotase
MEYKDILIRNATIVNEGRQYSGYVHICGQFIKATGEGDMEPIDDCTVIDVKGLLLLPGVIDCHVHFREPGMTHKADMSSESRAAVAGGVTSFFEMPNTQPQTITLELLEQKMALAAEKSLANYSFFLGASNDNISEIVNANPRTVCGVKVFFGASTGNMLVDNINTLEEIFKHSPIPVAAHCEDETTIRINSDAMRAKYGDDVPMEMHPLIRSAEACFHSSELAVTLALKYNTRLHITHLSTEAELSLLDNTLPLEQKRITAEACTHYLWFCDKDYARLGTKLKVNPAVKSSSDRAALIQGLLDNKIDIISTDHAPHLAQEKAATYFKAPSGTPLVQHSLQAMLQLVKQGKMALTTLVEKMCHAPAVCYGIEKRGFIRSGYFADLVLVNPDQKMTVQKENILYKCGWSVFEGTTFDTRVEKTFVNGRLVYDMGTIYDEVKGLRLTFDRK